MYLPKINTSDMSLRYSRSTNSSSLSTNSTKSKDSNPSSVLIQLCLHPDETYACRSMRLLLSPRYGYSPNVSDDFGCNLLMYILRYQRYRLLDFLLKHYSADLNFHDKDRQGNTLLHYAVIYSGIDTDILEKLIEKYRKFGIRMDERNNFGFTPLLLAAFCGRYDFVSIFLTKTDSSPFVRDHLHEKNIFDYIEPRSFDFRSQIIQPDAKIKRLFYQTLPGRDKTYGYKNFFELFFLRSIEDQTNFFRSSLIEFYHSDHLPHLLRYLNQRYPRIKTPRESPTLPTTSFVIQRDNSNLNVHQILTLFDPKLKPKANSPPKKLPPSSKSGSAFKRLSTKLTTISAFSKTQTGKKRLSITSTIVK